MGCASVRDKISDEEIAITLMESQLEYFKSSCILVDHVIRKYSFNDSINQKQWESICEDLEIKTESNPVSPLVTEFYQDLKDPSQSFNLKQVLVLGILLSNGMSRQKARLIFEVFDDKAADVLTKETLETMTDMIKNISIDRLPKLVHNSTNPPCSSTQVRKYSLLLSKKYIEVKEKFIELISSGNNETSLTDFVSLFDNEENGRLLTTHGFRYYILSL